MAAVRAPHSPASPPRTRPDRQIFFSSPCLTRQPTPPACAQIRHHFQFFLLGGVTALGAGYYRVHQDVWSAAEAVDSRLDTLGKSAVSGQSALQKQVVALEGEVAKLKGAIAAMQEKAKE